MANRTVNRRVFIPDERVQLVRLLADRTNDTTSFVDATGLSAPLDAGNSYLFEFFVRWQSALPTNGVLFAVNGPTADHVVITSQVPVSATATNMRNDRAYNSANTPTASVDVAEADFLARVTGIVRATASGVLVLRFAAEVATALITVRAGSLLRVTRVD